MPDGGLVPVGGGVRLGVGTAWTSAMAGTGNGSMMGRLGRRRGLASFSSMTGTALGEIIGRLGMLMSVSSHVRELGGGSWMLAVFRVSCLTPLTMFVRLNCSEVVEWSSWLVFRLMEICGDVSSRMISSLTVFIWA